MFNPELCFFDARAGTLPKISWSTFVWLHHEQGSCSPNDWSAQHARQRWAYIFKPASQAAVSVTVSSWSTTPVLVSMSMRMGRHGKTLEIVWYWHYWPWKDWPFKSIKGFKLHPRRCNLRIGPPGTVRVKKPCPPPVKAYVTGSPLRQKSSNNDSKKQHT